ncbi:ferritin-like domain-containing protein [Pseudarthrobacter sp. R1]|uniref:DUF4439 domain-containing protein n=1 Tax=Pseudarthrobacter sp. R1 TaxID=2944934 RepID=UPI00210CD819|nr:DUF4439 domain-containing protein [Pseudarthrobacter sp. R1]MCQ6269967.1 ferritin-like domain-containing protein [Pseudarthrobacter sp. R1]
MRSTGMALAASGGNAAAGGTPAGPLEHVVTLLTIQARALLLPAGPASAEAAAPATATASLPAGAATPPVTPPPSNPPAQATLAEFAAALAASGQQRLRDAETVDGGMARLLAASGTAQLLAAEQLGAPAAPAPEGQSPEGQSQDGKLAPTGKVTAAGPGSTEPAGASACPATPAAGSISVGAALAAAAEAELEAVYGYQAAHTRLPPEGARPASDFLAQHQDLADQAAAYSLMLCGAPSPQPPGYVLDPGFLDAPAAGLARLEAATLPAYGDIVAITGSTTRAWALSALQGAARRAQHWGADENPLPGLVLDEAQLPQLPV